MKKFRSLTILVVIMLVMAAMATPALASPAEIDRGTRCAVKDANGNSYIDLIVHGSRS